MIVLGQETDALSSAPKASVSWPNTIKFYSNDMCGVDIMDQKTAAYRLDCKIK